MGRRGKQDFSDRLGGLADRRDADDGVGSAQATLGFGAGRGCVKGSLSLPDISRLNGVADVESPLAIGGLERVGSELRFCPAPA